MPARALKYAPTFAKQSFNVLLISEFDYVFIILSSTIINCNTAASLVLLKQLIDYRSLFWYVLFML